MEPIQKKIKEKLNDLQQETRSKFNIKDEYLKKEIEKDLHEKFNFDENILKNAILIVDKRFDFDINKINLTNINSIFDILTSKSILDNKTINFYKTQLKDIKNQRNILIDIKNQLSKEKEILIFNTYFNLFDALRKQYINDLINKMKLIEQMTKNLKSFSNIFGRFWDLSEHDLYKLDNSFFLKLEELLSKQEFIKRIAELLGRLAATQNKFEEHLVKEMIFIPSSRKSYYSPENTTSIKFGNDISIALKHQLALRNNIRTKKIFDLNFVEKKLLELEQKGKLLDEEEIFRKERRLKEDSSGPFIMCIDTSGSMHGEPENIAKALSLAIMRIARRENRKCFIINFSTNIIEFDATDINKNFSKFYNFLQMSFSGGTDVEPALERACEKCKEQEYKNADVIIISDFIINQINDKLSREILELKKKKIRFNALSIGCSQIKEHMNYFDNNWIYDGSDESIKKIINDLNKISENKNVDLLNNTKINEEGT